MRPFDLLFFLFPFFYSLTPFISCLLFTFFLSTIFSSFSLNTSFYVINDRTFLRKDRVLNSRVQPAILFIESCHFFFHLRLSEGNNKSTYIVGMQFSYLNASRTGTAGCVDLRVEVRACVQEIEKSVSLSYSMCA